MGYLLSIVVPTKDRYFYLKHLIELIKSFNSDDIELIIQDNTYDNAEIIEYLDNLDYPHLKYFHTKEPISVSENSTNAILNSTGEYVCFIGDDDGVTRHIVDCVKWMKENDIEVLKSQFASYKWPSFVNGRFFKLSSTISLADYSGGYYEFDGIQALRRLIKEGFSTLSYMPKVYNGITKRTTLDKILKSTGSFFPGPSPDMANAVALCILSNKNVYIDFPIIIGGQSVNVGGGVRKIKGGYARLSDLPFLPKNSVDTWEKTLPQIWCVETVWPESGIKGIRALKKTELLDLVDYDYLMARFIVARPSIKEMAYPFISNMTKVRMLVLMLTIKKRLRTLLSATKFFLFRKESDNLKIFKGCNNIIEAEKFIVNKYPFFLTKPIR